MWLFTGCVLFLPHSERCQSNECTQIRENHALYFTLFNTSSDNRGKRDCSLYVGSLTAPLINIYSNSMSNNHMSRNTCTSAMDFYVLLLLYTSVYWAFSGWICVSLLSPSFSEITGVKLFCGRMPFLTPTRESLDLTLTSLTTSSWFRCLYTDSPVPTTVADSQQHRR